jgi:hypothetical protein
MIQIVMEHKRQRNQRPTIPASSALVSFGFLFASLFSSYRVLPRIPRPLRCVTTREEALASLGMDRQKMLLHCMSASMNRIFKLKHQQAVGSVDHTIRN